MAKPQPSPGDLTSPRKQALAIGTDPSKFPDDLPYDYAGGFPTGTPGQGGTARDNVTPAQPEALPPQPSPFK